MNEGVSTKLNSSVIINLRLGRALPCEVGRVVLLDVPSVVGVGDIVTPAHGLSVANSVGESSKAHGRVPESVLGTLGPAHERSLVMTPGTELNSPSLTVGLVCRVAVEMLSLSHKDAGNLVTLLLTIPRGEPVHSAHAGFSVQFFSLVEADAIGVCFEEALFFSVAGNAHTLDGSILELLTVG